MSLIIRGPVSRSEAALKETCADIITSDVGKCDRACQHCGALRWGKERTKRYQSTNTDEYSNCCKAGQVMLPVYYFPQRHPPKAILWLLTSTDPGAEEARYHIRDYNNALSFTSMTAKHDWSVRGPKGVYSFRVNGQLHHWAGSGLPKGKDIPCFSQIYTIGDGGTKEAAMRQKHYDNKLNNDLLLELQSAINERNSYAKLFKNAKEILKRDKGAKIVVKSVKPGRRDDLKRYNLPTVDEIGMVIPGGGSITGDERRLVLERQDGRLVPINDMHTGYLPMRYVLCFPDGAQQWSEHYKQLLPVKKRKPDEMECQVSEKRVSSLQWFAWLLFERRGTFSALLHCRSLFQELIVDLYLCVERGRLCYFDMNQDKMKAEKYKHIISDLDQNLEVVGRQVVLPASFIGGPRHMRNLYQDSIALSRKYGKPSLFLTMTGNPEWPEITDALKYDETPSDRPDIVARVFKMKLNEVMEDLTIHHRLGRVVSWVYVIEFQKRGLPHAHIILIFSPEYIPKTAEDIDDLVCAEIPDPETEPLLHKLVTNSMLHGPCGSGFKSPCWNREDKRCVKKFPKPFQNETLLQENAYPLYRRRDNGRHWIKHGFRFTNQHVVPYNRFLLMKYKCHFNVEIAQGIVGYKYIYKYVAKGHDRSNLEMREAEDLETEIFEDVNGGGVEMAGDLNTVKKRKVQGRNEVAEFVDGRYIGPVEAAWRLLQYDMNGRSPGVYALPVHLPEEQEVYFWDTGEAEDRVTGGNAANTMLTDYFRLNRENAIGRNKVNVRNLLYEEIPDYFSWANKIWKDRIKDIPCASRMAHSEPKEGERFYLRLLLANVKGARSFVDLRTVNGIVFNTFRDAANQLDLLESDKHYSYCLKEAAFWMTGQHLRELFAMILVHNSPSDPVALWREHEGNLTDDCDYRMREDGYEGTIAEDERLLYGLYLIKLQVEMMGGIWNSFNFGSFDKDKLRQILDKVGNTKAKEELKLQRHQEYVETNVPKLTSDQASIYSYITGEIERGCQILCYLDGPGGTGKTFVLNTILNYLESKSLCTVAVASAGVAAQLLLNGKTAHFAFKIPFKHHERSVCSLSGRDEFGQLLQRTTLIVWDEISTQHKDHMNCVDRSLQHLRQDSRPFGGISVVFAGDFRQTLPIVPGGNTQSQFYASLKSIPIWKSLKKLRLSRNLRLLGNGTTVDDQALAYADWLLDLGTGKLQRDDEAILNIDHVATTLTSPGVDIDMNTIEWIYQDVGVLSKSKNWSALAEYYSERMLITPLNNTVRLVNRILSERIVGEVKIATSLDSVDDTCFEPIGQEYLNAMSFNNFPNHKINLRRGLPVILLRNLNVADGLCNGTRLLIVDFQDKVIQCLVISGPKKGKLILLPKIRLTHEPDQVLAIRFTRKQFPIAEAFCLTINKSQGQSLDKVGVLLPNPVFSHGQLYVALSRCKSVNEIRVALGTSALTPVTKNIVLKEALID